LNRKYFACIIIFIACFTIKSHAQYLQFIENKGQWDDSVKYKASFNGNDLLIKPSGYKVVLRDKNDLKTIAEYFSGHHIDSSSRLRDSSIDYSVTKNIRKNPRTLSLHCHAYEMSFLNADSNAVAVPDKPLNTYNNYFIGADSTKWAKDCRIFNGLTYKNVYKNVDVRYYSDNGNLKYDIIVKPGADISKIALKFDGLDGLLINKYGNLTMKTTLGDVYQSIPSSYQIIKGVKNKVKAAFSIKGDEVHFKLDRYDKTATLIIDPTQIFATFVGSLADDWGYTATYDNAGNFYAGGIAFDNGFVNRGLGGYDVTFNGGDASEGRSVAVDISLIKFNPTGNLALFSTYLGGSGDEVPCSLVVDSRGDLIVSGRTSSTDYPVTASTFGNGGADDIILSKLSGDGKTLMASRKFGGSGNDGVNIQPKYVSEGILSLRRNYGDDSRSEVITDNSDNIYLASSSQSSDFPVTDNAFKKKLTGSQDGVFIKASPDLNKIYNCSLIGGSADDAAFVLSISKTTGNIYIGGGTSSKDLAFKASDAPQGILHSTYQNGDCDGFIAELSSDANTLLKICYVGTAGNDMVYGVQTDKFGYPFIMGTTTQSFPVYKSPFNANGNQANGKQFITKLNPDLTQVLYSANFGKGNATNGNPDISPTAFLVDVCGNVYVSGWGGKANDAYYKSSTIGLHTTANALKTSTDGNDFYFFVLEKDATSQLFGSFFGINDPDAYGDHVDGGTSRFDRRGVIYQAICADCGKKGVIDFTTTGSWSPGNPAQTGALCNEAAIKIAFELSGVIASLRSSINGVPRDSVGCIPLTVEFADTIALGKKYIWSFGDGSPDVTTTAPNTSHTYTIVGDYHARVISIDSSSCNIADTAYLTIKARSNEAKLGYTIAKIPPCESLTYQFTNTSVPPAGLPFSSNDFTWDFGDGTTLVSSAPTIPPHTYPATGTYNVKLYLNDTNYCNSPDSLVKQLRVATVLVAQFETPAVGCAPYNAVFNNTSLGGQSFVWDFGDGTTSTNPYPTHLYQNPGTYTVRLTATDNTTCNPTDDTTAIITVVEGPAASFSISPTEPKENTPFEFQNTSTNAVKYKWDFGDGDTLVTTNILPVNHLYNYSDTFTVCLIAFNANGCTDTTCQQVAALVTPLADVPNAFSPNGDGINDFIGVRGYGVAKMSWNIFNRWGQLVFSSTSIDNKWDGRYKGTLQPQDVYAYTLNITFTDNTVLRKKGDITLLR
jgi:gliding motility-associated-like protein